MTREQAKELLPIIQAFSEDKIVQIKGPDNKWYDRNNKKCEIHFNSDPQKYRIKPEPTYHPFKNAEECWQEMLKHQPFGWVKHKVDNLYSFICRVDGYSCHFAINEYWAFDTIFKNDTFADGTPFGIKE